MYDSLRPLSSTSSSASSAAAPAQPQGRAKRNQKKKNPHASNRKYHTTSKPVRYTGKFFYRPEMEDVVTFSFSLQRFWDALRKRFAALSERLLAVRLCSIVRDPYLPFPCHFTSWRKRLEKFNNRYLFKYFDDLHRIDPDIFKSIYRRTRSQTPCNRALIGKPSRSVPLTQFKK